MLSSLLFTLCFLMVTCIIIVSTIVVIVELFLEEDRKKRAIGYAIIMAIGAVLICIMLVLSR